MKFSKKYYTLIFSFALTILVALQAYYIYNSYRLITKDLNKEAREIADKVMDYMKKYETENNDDKIIEYFKKLNHDEKKQFDELQMIREKVDYNYKIFTPLVDSLLEVYSKEKGFEISLRTDVFSVYDGLNHKELLQNKNYIIYESTRKMVHPVNINQSVWSSDDISNERDTDRGIESNERHKYKIKGKTDYELLNIRFLILKKIIPLIMVSLLIVALIIFLYWKSMQNLAKQEEKINQLHVTIDSIAHELNTPITTMKFALHQIQHSDTKEIMNRQINRLENTVDSIFAKNEENNELLNEIILSEIIQKAKRQFHTIEIISQSLFEKNKNLQANDFQQIFQNLIENSIKYGASRIELNLKFQHEISLKFSDDGIGIPSNEIPFIFDKYYRINRSINQNVNGLGVGLYLVKNIVGRYSGTIHVQNNREKGVEFLIRMPNEN
ncbi:sensor histidine kinase [Empedobacter brevis]|uniref:sensor histidine kinase n=1 Tax=Empedobacter brevis TaxID=247 RepID=UPI00289D1227|nr:HAMP domain-containing sensor histidine kinase [Empedobacter brevis]